ncbi:MAG: polysaccharide deacetylase family protein [Parvibaculum sp.]
MTPPFRQALSAASPALMRKGLLSLYFSGAAALAPASLHGIGTIFMLHRVRALDATGFAPNRILEVTPSFLEGLLLHVKARNIACVTLDEAVERIAQGKKAERFAVFTLDDGYRDNLKVAAPIFERHKVPFTVYLATDLPDGTAELWWVALERIIATGDDVHVRFADGEEVFSTRTTAEKNAAWQGVYWRLRKSGERHLREEVRRLALEHRIDYAAITRELAMSWDELRLLAQNPYAHIEAHTASHIALSQLSADEARADIERGLARHENELGYRPKHFSYPYGDPGSAGPRDFNLVKEFGFRSATTTCKGLIHPRHAQAMTALPRLSLNGNLQDLRMIDVLMSGLPFALAKAAGAGGID